jgi:hypothetical protein
MRQKNAAVCIYVCVRECDGGVADSVSADMMPGKTHTRLLARERDRENEFVMIWHFAVCYCRITYKSIIQEYKKVFFLLYMIIRHNIRIYNFSRICEADKMCVLVREERYLEFDKLYSL